ncbi:MAG TPA: dTDP-4-dehydrorhamnose 3,5-epimerase [Paludibacteraceae bacterium]|nr:dTDP-4-dehydrorhamnose 3,5-epimerase [Paludibacteraceae bacterium]HQF50464.1 dTDP-4-dehydrorhamnose 3,5-epimerase [Paludibacteraceae bacterium]
MEIIKTHIEGVVIIKPKVFSDPRGYFYEAFSQREFNEKVRPIRFVQDNESMSSYGVMRGLHFQTPPFTQSKLVRCVKGAVLDVAVDIRKGSPTYGQHVQCLLCAHDEEGKRIAEQYKELFFPLNRGTEGVCGLQFFVPRGFAHGFAVLSETAVFQYKCDNYYAPANDGGISIKDDSLGIDWRIPTENALLSEKDTKHALLKDFDSPFSIDMDLYPEFK